MNQTKTKRVPLGGGLDLVSSPLSVSPGRALGMFNYEPWFRGGYRRIFGYERYDGRPAPSDATFLGFDVDDATAPALTVGTAITGVTSGATGVVIGISGNSIGVTKVVGTFQEDEFLNAGAYQIATEPVEGQAPSVAIEEAWTLAAQDEYRDDIAVVPGSGAPRGAWRRGSNVYAVRDNAGATAGILHKSSASGWTTTGVTMAWYVYFDGGGAGAAVALPAEGATINGQTSGATGVVHRVVLQGGATGTNDAYGYLVLTAVSGTFSNNENLRVVTAAFALANGASTRFAFPVGGTYRFRNHNFYGGAGTYRTYGVNGVGPAFEIDENNVVSPLLFAGVPDQPPSNVPFLLEVHRNHLFLAFPGGSLVHTAVGDPLLVNGFLGAAEFGVGDGITGLSSVVGGVLVIATERTTQGLFGANIDDWEMRMIGERTGAKLFTAQKLDTVYALDDLGITSIARTDSFGDFIGATVSQDIQPLIDELRNSATDSVVVRASNQYRVYFNDNSALVMYVPNVGMENELTMTKMKVEFGFLQYPITIRKIYNTEDQTGLERTYFVSDSGFVYEDQIGTSFDGEEIESGLRLHYNHCGTPTIRKKFRRADFEMFAESPLALSFNYDLTYGSDDSAEGLSAVDLGGAGGFYDVDSWNTIFWDGQSVANAKAQLDGSGENIGFLIYNSSASARPFVLQGVTIHYDLRRLQR